MKLSPEEIKKLGFRKHEHNEFYLYSETNMGYYVRNGVCLFFNHPENATHNKGSYKIGYAEMVQGEYIATTFRWIETIEQLKQVYEAITNEIL